MNAEAPQTPIVAVVNRKGGVGKTSISFHLSEALAALDNSVLLVDLDFQADLTDGFFPPQQEPFSSHNTVAALFDTSLDYSTDQLIHPTPIPGISILPGHTDLENYEIPRHMAPEDTHYCLRSFLEPLTTRFDFILLDCRPSLGLLTWNALLAAEFVLVPFQPEQYGANGIPYMRAIIDEAAQGPNPRLRLLGYLLNEVTDRTKLHSRFEGGLRGVYFQHVFSVTVPRSIRYADAVVAKMPIRVYADNCPPQDRHSAREAAKVIDHLAGEMLTRIQRLRQMEPPTHSPETTTIKTA